MSQEAAVIGAFLSRRPGRGWVTTVGTVIEDARTASGRFPDTGAVDRSIYHGDPPVHAGLLAYLNVVDWVGQCLRPAGAASGARAPFLRALELFTDLAEPQREALYALRCAVLSPFAPVTGEARPKAFRFTISTDGSSPLARVQDTPWDGDLGIDRETLATVVDIRAFAGLVEEMYARLVTLHHDRRLEVALTGGAAELRRRSAFFHTDLS